MLADSLVAGSLMVADYVVFALVLVVSISIGVYFAWASRGQESSGNFLTGGRRLTALPVSISLTASFMSSITVLSNPAEVYCYGAIFVYVGLCFILSVVVASEVFIPVFYRLNVTSTYGYLEMRFNKATRLLGTVIFIVQTMLFTGIVIYGPALALSQIADMDLWIGILSTGIPCTLYCTLGYVGVHCGYQKTIEVTSILSAGGLKAVVWTDVFQMGIMLSGFLSVIIKSVILQGGLFNIISDSQQGGRLNFLDFDMNPLRRHTFWTILIGGTLGWTSVNGISQPQVQRYVSCKTITHARLACYIYCLGLCTFLVATVFAGMCLYSVYKNCDPWTAGKISTPDQLMPYLVMDTLTDNSGLPGLFFAAVFSGSLSTVSTSINALALVTLEDLIKPYTNMSEKHLFWMSKGLCFLYGILCIAMAGIASIMGRMMQAAVIIGGATGGPLLGIFILGILCPFANSKGALSGLLTGLAASSCLSIGGLIYPPSPAMAQPLPLTTEGCNFTTTDSPNWTSTVLPTEPSSIITSLVQNSDGNDLLGDTWHSPSYLYFGCIGTVTAVIVGLAVSLLTGGWTSRVESRLTLMREDTTFYHLFMFIKNRVMRRTGKLNIMKRQKEVGETNPGFCDTEMDLVNTSPK